MQRVEARETAVQDDFRRELFEARFLCKKQNMEEVDGIVRWPLLPPFDKPGFPQAVRQLMASFIPRRALVTDALFICCVMGRVDFWLYLASFDSSIEVSHTKTTT
jgi:hypothetical protein